MLYLPCFHLSFLYKGCQNLELFGKGWYIHSFTLIHRQYQYFRFSSAAPGIVTVRKGRDEKECHVNIFRQQGYVFGGNLPAELPPGGLSMESQDYLYKIIPSFLPPNSKNNSSQNNSSQNNSSQKNSSQNNSSPEPQKSPSES